MTTTEDTHLSNAALADHHLTAVDEARAALERAYSAPRRDISSTAARLHDQIRTGLKMAEVHSTLAVADELARLIPVTTAPVFPNGGKWIEGFIEQDGADVECGVTLTVADGVITLELADLELLVAESTQALAWLRKIEVAR